MTTLSETGTNMIIVAGYVFIKPDRREQAAQVALKMTAATKLEAGCIAYDFYADLADANRFHVYEEWDTNEALQAHLKTPHMAEFMQALPDLIASPAVINRYESAGSSRLM